MGRRIVMLQMAVSLILLSGVARATDGDVDYSSPYITVDPKTGQVITVNPGPRLKTHSSGDMPGMSQMQTEQPSPETSPVASQVSVDQPAAAVTTDNKKTGFIAIVAVGLLVFATMAYRRIRSR
jgi:hypothetical protein